jgi:3',5'-cyclic-AMP phosphodiesterase
MSRSHRSEEVMPRIAIVTDIHHGRDAVAKKGSHALRLLDGFADFVGNEKPDLVLDLGDRISDEGRETDLRLEQEVSEGFEPIRAVAPVHHLCGNHDRDFLSIADNERILGQPLRNATLELDGWRIVLFRADAQMRRPHGFRCSEEDLSWLAETVAATDRPLLVASHVPLSGHGQDGNYYFENTPAYSRYPETNRIRDILRGCRQPILCLAGHVHWNTVTTVDGVTHLTQQSLTESFTMSPARGEGEPCGAYGLLELGAETVSWRVHGADAFALELPLRQLARRWCAPLQPLSELPDESGRQARIEAFDRLEHA